MSHHKALTEFRDNRRFGSGAEAPIRAVLGPTNTGKTHFALERLLAHHTGMIGFPLRLLARENYDRLVSEKGVRAVALVTGEEKIIPSRARYFVCTVESMPLSRKVDCLVVDEIQLCGDPERGHIFTDRLLHARGLEETLFLGSDTMAPLVRKLIPNVEITSRERLSTLSYTGSKRITRLPERSAIVTFSASEVYGLAEMLRVQRGGAAVVMGALSPRTRNAQVDLFQSGDVNYLVATDAIGMGLNLDLSHVAFARLEKFDGQRSRRLSHQEIAQIAGRAGRYHRPGSFGTTVDCRPFEGDEIEAVETHQFDPMEMIYWRNRELDFSSPSALARSLDIYPDKSCLRGVRKILDQAVLQRFLQDEECMNWASGRVQTALLWEICQIPDFQKTLSEAHHRLLRDIFKFLTHHDHLIPESWVESHLKQLDRLDGDIDTLMQRLAHVRTWTYIAYRSQWLRDSAHWQGRSRLIEDRLSDALHEKLLQRFVDKRMAVLTRQLTQGEELDAHVDDSGQIYVAGQFVASLSGFHLEVSADITESARQQTDMAHQADEEPSEKSEKSASQTLILAAKRALRQQLPRLVHLFSETGDAEIQLSPSGRFIWRGAEIAILKKGTTYLQPGIQLREGSVIEGELAEKVKQRLMHWLTLYLEGKLPEIYQLQKVLKQGAIQVSQGKRKKSVKLSAAMRAILFEMSDQLGFVRRSDLLTDLKTLTADEYKILARLGIIVGPTLLMIPRYYKLAPFALRQLLWQIYHAPPRQILAELPSSEYFSQAVTSCVISKSDQQACQFYRFMGFEVIHKPKPHLVRGNCLSKLLETVRQISVQEKKFALRPEWASLIGGSVSLVAACLKQYGYQAKKTADGESFSFKGRKRGAQQQSAKTVTSPKHSSFAALAQLRTK